MAGFNINGLLSDAVKFAVPVCFLAIACLESNASEDSINEMESWLEEVAEALTDPDSSTSPVSSGLAGLIAAAQENDERQTVLQAHIEVIQARALAGRSWPDPEIRVGIEERDRENLTNRQAALRFRLPDRVDRRLLEKISHVDIDWTNKRINLLRSEIALDVKSLFATGLFARIRLITGSRRLEELIQQERQLHILQESKQASQLEEAELVVEELKLFRSLRNEFSILDNSISKLASLGIDSAQVRAVFQSSAWNQLLADPIPALDGLLSTAVRNSEDTLQYEREDGMLSVRLNEVKRSWLPSPSFFQIGWGDRKEGGDSRRANEWGALAGFTIDLFDDHQEQVLLSIRRETDLNHKVLLRNLEEKVKNQFMDIQSDFNAYKQFFAIFEPAFESIKRTLEESAATTTNEATLWKVRKDLYGLESELWDMRWMLVESQLEFESTLGSILSDGG